MHIRKKKRSLSAKTSLIKEMNYIYVIKENLQKARTPGVFKKAEGRKIANRAKGRAYRGMRSTF